MDAPADFSAPKSDVEEAKSTLIVIIYIANKKEVVLANPSESTITAVYADESIIMLGSHDAIFSLSPGKLFLQDGPSPSSQDTWRKTILPSGLEKSSKNRVYAFWHTKNQVKVDVFTHSTVRAEVSIFTFRTQEGIEKIKMLKRR